MYMTGDGVFGLLSGSRYEAPVMAYTDKWSVIWGMKQQKPQTDSLSIKGFPFCPYDL